MNEKALQALCSKPVFLASEARALGIHPSRLSYYVKTHLIRRLSHGVYQGVEATVNTDFRWEELIVTAKSVPNGVISLISALAIYDLTDEVPREHWIAIPHSTSAPNRSHTRFIRMRDINTGKITYTLGDETIFIFDRERTIVDAFRYLSKEIAIKALKIAIKNKKQKIDIKKLQKYAKQFRINLDPYILTVMT